MDTVDAKPPRGCATDNSHLFIYCYFIWIIYGILAPDIQWNQIPKLLCCTFDGMFWAMVALDLKPE